MGFGVGLDYCSIIVEVCKYLLMSNNNKKNSTGSVLGKIAIGLAGIVGGLLIGKAIDQATKTQQPSLKTRKAIVDSVQYTKNIEDYDTIEQLMTCPITNCIMKLPVIVTECGHTFEKEQIVKWVQAKGHCPLCNVATSVNSLKPNYQLQQIIAEYLRNKKQEREKERENAKVEEKVQEKKEVSKSSEQQEKAKVGEEEKMVCEVKKQGNA